MAKFHLRKSHRNLATHSTPLDKTTPSTHHQFMLKPPKKSSRTKSLLSTFGIFLLAPLVALLLTAFVFQSYQVDGPSMETTLKNNDRLIIVKTQRTWSKITGHPYIPARGDVIVFVERDLSQYDGRSGSKQLIKRVIGLPGDRVVVQNNTLTIYNSEHPNGFQPDNSYGYQPALNNTSGNIDLTVPENEIFVCGDNRLNSLDSRTFGSIPVKDVVGRLSLRIFPLHDAKKF